MARILVVDDEPHVLGAFQDLLEGGGHDVVTSEEATSALGALEEGPFDLVVMDVCLQGMDGLEALRRIKQQWPSLPVIVMTAHGTMQTAIEATKLGAFDYHLKPFDPAEMLAAIDKALEGSRLTQNQVVRAPEMPDAIASHSLIGNSSQMQQVFMSIGRVAATNATVLIRGESGTGKERVARAVHQHSQRAARPLWIVNCVAIPDTLLESELFGYERGAFTGATSQKIGKFEQADGGTLLLDEIGDISLGIQAKILRVLQERCFERLGGNKTVHVDVRVLAATNRNLEEAIVKGAFREDLYHRLNVVTISIPPLRERPDDIPALVEYFLSRYAKELGTPKPPVSPEARKKLQEYPWPGNVRQLAHCIQRALIFTRGYPIQATDISLTGTAGDHTGSRTCPEGLGELVRRYLIDCGGEHAHEQLLGHVERLLIVEALHRTSGNQTHAARLLGLARPTLHAKIQKHNLDSGSSETTAPG
ncbi:MAG: sigma-54-dependent Fis family transcriptional regulator [Pirellulales bacterium]|nr:sigma-54-dependent Fis family transcriptional regulator [Pirellulales bacterium]